MKVRLAALVPVLAVGLTGCSADEAPRPEPLPSASSPSPSPVAQGVPPSAQAATPQGAAAFVSYYYEELGRAFSSLDTSTIERLSAPECVDCRNIISTFRRERAAGKRYSGGEVTVRSAEAVAVDATRTAVTILYDTAPLVDLTAATPTPMGGTRAKALEVEVTRNGTGWLVSNIVQVDQ